MHSWRLTRRVLPFAVIFALIATVLVIGTRPAAGPGKAAPAPSPAKTYEHEVPRVQAPKPSATPEPSETTPEPSKPSTPADNDEKPAAKPKVVAELPQSEVESYSLLGVTWDPSPKSEDLAVDVRWREDGGWSKWTELELDLENTATEGGRPGTEPRWIGNSDGVAVRVTSTSGFQPEGLKVATIDPGVSNETTPVSFETNGASEATQAATATQPSTATQAAAVAQPAIILRSAWGASNGGSCDSPIYGDTTRGAVIHHTAGTNSYTKAQSAGIVKATQAYHTGSRDWCDIGYNFLVDKYGQIFEGRKGGITKTVRAAHSGNGPVNQETMGVSLMGTFTGTEATAAMKTAVVNLVAWRFASYKVSAKGTYKLGGVTLNRIAGHRNVVGTECPGAKVYAWLSASGGLRDRVEDKIASGSAPVLGKPSNLKAVPKEGGATLSWTAGSGATSYNVCIYRSATATACEKVVNGVTGTSTTVTGLTQQSGVDYYFVLRSVAGGLSTSATARVGFDVLGPPVAVPVKPTNLKAVPSQGGATLSWTAGKNATSYNVCLYRSSTATACNKVVNGVTGTSTTVTGLTQQSGVDYYFVVRSVNGGMSTSPTARVGFDVLGAPPAAVPVKPTNLKAVPTATGATLSWKAGKNATSYNVCLYRSSTATSCDKVVNGVTGTSTAVTGLTQQAGMDYYFVVRSVNGGMSTSPTARVGFELLGVSPDAVPVKPTGLKAVTTTNSATLSWNAGKNATSYNVCLYTSGTITTCARTYNGVTGTKLALSGLKPTGGTDFFFVVRSVNGGMSTSPTARFPFDLKTGTTPSSSADVLSIPSSRNIALTGHGYGHGIGMSQYGAQGAATSGKKYGEILNYYYPGTTLSAKSGYMRVLLSADTTADVVVKARSGLVFRNLVNNATATLPTKVGSASVSQWRIIPNSAKPSESLLQYKTSGWATSTRWTGQAQFEAAADPIYLILPNGSSVGYRSVLRSIPPSKGSSDRNTINYLSIENYVRGVVSAEMPSSWKPEALKAQSVAARTYGVRSMVPSRYYDICDTTSCQVYGGTARETSATDSAIAATSGKILTYGGTPAFTQFSSSSGGWSAAGSFAYLKEKVDAYDNWSGNGVHTWTKTIAASTVEKKYTSIGTLRTLKITKRSGEGDWGGRVSSVTFAGSKGSKTLTGNEARTAFGLRSNWFRVN